MEVALNCILHFTLRSRFLLIFMSILCHGARYDNSYSRSISNLVTKRMKLGKVNLLERWTLKATSEKLKNISINKELSYTIAASIIKFLFLNVVGKDFCTI